MILMCLKLFRIEETLGSFLDTLTLPLSLDLTGSNIPNKLDFWIRKYRENFLWGEIIIICG